jgi:hypothetical protein
MLTLYFVDTFKLIKINVYLLFNNVSNLKRYKTQTLQI